MKKNCLLMLCILLLQTTFVSSSLFARTDCIPMLQTGKTWCLVQYSQRHVQSESYAYESPEIIHYTLDAPEETSGRVYYAMHKIDRGEDRVISYLREENGKVFRLIDDAGGEALVFNFTAEVGDEFAAYSINHKRWAECTVSSVAERTVAGNISLKEVVVSSTAVPLEGETRPYAPYSNAWLEGVGAIGAVGYPEKVMVNAAGPERNLMLGINVGSAPAPIIAYASSSDVCIPFDFDDIHFHGRYICSEEREAADGRMYCDHDDLEYVLENGTLHITGYMWAANTPHHYLFCEDNKEGEIHISIDEMGVTAEAKCLIPVDIRIPGFAAGDYEVVERFSQNRVPLSSRPTGISIMQDAVGCKTQVYDLQGRRLQQVPTRGIFIQGGRKIVK